MANLIQKMSFLMYKLLLLFRKGFVTLTLHNLNRITLSKVMLSTTVVEEYFSDMIVFGVVPVYHIDFQVILKQFSTCWKTLL